MIKDLKSDLEEMKHKQRSELNNLKSQSEHEVQKGLANTLKIEGQLKQTQSENKQLQEEMANLQKKFQDEYQAGIKQLRDLESQLAQAQKALAAANDQSQQKDKVIQDVTGQLQQTML